MAERVIRTTKRGLRKYGLLRGSHRDCDLILPWIAMGYRSRRHASLASYSPSQLLYGRELVILSFIQEQLAHVVDLDNSNIWAGCCKSKLNFSRGPCLWPCNICPLLNTVTHCAMHAFAVVVIDLFLSTTEFNQVEYVDIIKYSISKTQFMCPWMHIHT